MQQVICTESSPQHCLDQQELKNNINVYDKGLCIRHVYNDIMKTLKMMSIYKYIDMERCPILTTNKTYKTDKKPRNIRVKLYAYIHIQMHV